MQWAVGQRVAERNQRSAAAFKLHSGATIWNRCTESLTGTARRTLASIAAAIPLCYAHLVYLPLARYVLCVNIDVQKSRGRARSSISDSRMARVPAMAV